MSPQVGQPICHVSGADKLPAGLNSASWCEAIGEALARLSPHPKVVEVEVQSPHLALATVILADGRRLAPVRVGRSDRPLGVRSVKMLAEAVAAQVKTSPSQ